MVFIFLVDWVEVNPVKLGIFLNETKKTDQEKWAC